MIALLHVSRQTKVNEPNQLHQLEQEMRRKMGGAQIKQRIQSIYVKEMETRTEGKNTICLDNKRGQ